MAGEWGIIYAANNLNPERAIRRGLRPARPRPELTKE
jgi:hypothetical protein